MPNHENSNTLDGCGCVMVAAVMEIIQFICLLFKKLDRNWPRNSKRKEEEEEEEEEGIGKAMAIPVGVDSGFLNVW